jgi:DNA-binding response OmpR family regulator
LSAQQARTIERNLANPDYIQTVWGVGYKICG